MLIRSTTDANGDYSFTGLPYGTYTVDVTDEDNVLDGTWHSLGTDSETDPVSVTVSATPVNADFGYYSELAALGDYVWEDLNADGIVGPKTLLYLMRFSIVEPRLLGVTEGGG